LTKEVNMLRLAIGIRRYIHTHTLPDILRSCLWNISENFGVKAYGEDFTVDYNLGLVS
jgi:hypothetical protein